MNRISRPLRYSSAPGTLSPAYLARRKSCLRLRLAASGFAVALDPGRAIAGARPQDRKEALVHPAVSGTLVAPVDVASGKIAELCQPRPHVHAAGQEHTRSEEHMSELQSLMRNSNAVVCM